MLPSLSLDSADPALPLFKSTASATTRRHSEASLHALRFTSVSICTHEVAVIAKCKDAGPQMTFRQAAKDLPFKFARATSAKRFIAILVFGDFVISLCSAAHKSRSERCINASTTCESSLASIVDELTKHASMAALASGFISVSKPASLENGRSHAMTFLNPRRRWMFFSTFVLSGRTPSVDSCAVPFELLFTFATPLNAVESFSNMAISKLTQISIHDFQKI